MIIKLSGRIDSNNASAVEEDIVNQLSGHDGEPVEIDASELEYVSSAGLRVILSAQKIMNKQGKMAVRNVNETISEIFEVTGFSDSEAYKFLDWCDFSAEFINSMNAYNFIMVVKHKAEQYKKLNRSDKSGKIYLE